MIQITNSMQVDRYWEDVVRTHHHRAEFPSDSEHAMKNQRYCTIILMRYLRTLF